MKRPELPALTGLRFYAALLVFFSHVTVIPGMEVLAGKKLIFNAGVVGVGVFFVLSGFVLTYNYGDRFARKLTGPACGRFVWDRLTRIYPLHLAMLILMIPVQLQSPNLPLDWRAVPFHLFLAQCFWPVSDPTFYQYLNVPSWSISCEWFFYLLAPLAIYLTNRAGGRWLLTGAVVIFATILGALLLNASNFARLYFVSWFAPSRWIEFLAGVAVARWFLSHGAPGPRARRGLQMMGLVFLGAGAAFREHAPWPLHGGLLYMPGAVMLVLGLAAREGGGPLALHLGQPWLRHLGMASFAFYLIQAPLLRIGKGVCYKLGWVVDDWFSFAWVAMSWLVVIQACALLVHARYEQPMQRYLRGLWGRAS